MEVYRSAYDLVSADLVGVVQVRHIAEILRLALVEPSKAAMAAGTRSVGLHGTSLGEASEDILDVFLAVLGRPANDTVRGLE